MVDLDETMVVAYGWEPMTGTPSTALGFERPYDRRAVLVRRRYASVREWPFVRSLLEPEGEPWGFFVLDLDAERVIEEEGFRTAFDAREQLQSYLKNHKMKRV